MMILQIMLYLWEKKTKICILSENSYVKNKKWSIVVAGSLLQYYDKRTACRRNNRNTSMRQKPEALVVDSVKKYFKSLRFRSKTKLKTGYRVNIGSKKCQADVVLRNENDILVLVECKKKGYTGTDGIYQLKSYMCATDAPLGIFAASDQIDRWLFYENLGLNNIKERDYDQYKKLLDKMTSFDLKKEDRIEKRLNELIEETAKKKYDLSGARIQKLTNDLIDQEARKQASLSQSRIIERSTELVETEARSRVTEQRIQDKLSKLITQHAKDRLTRNQIETHIANSLKEKCDQLETTLEQKQEELGSAQRLFGILFWLFVAVIVIGGFVFLR